MQDILQTILIVVSLLLIAIVLLQSGKASEASNIITGGNGMLFSDLKERGAEKFITRSTYVLGFIFIIVSLVLSFY